MVAADPIQVALRVAEALESCGVTYVVGGSVASSIAGEPRATLDVDMAVAMTEQQVEPFLAALGDEFYAEPHSLLRAIREKKSANLIHRETSTKVDLFISGRSPPGTGAAARSPNDSGAMCWGSSASRGTGSIRPTSGEVRRSSTW